MLYLCGQKVFNFRLSYYFFVGFGISVYVGLCFHYVFLKKHPCLGLGRRHRLNQRRRKKVKRSGKLRWEQWNKALKTLKMALKKELYTSRVSSGNCFYSFLVSFTTAIEAFYSRRNSRANNRSSRCIGRNWKMEKFDSSTNTNAYLC